MSLPSLIAVPAALQSFVRRAEESFLAAAGALDDLQAPPFESWPQARREAFARACAEIGRAHV